MKPSTLIRILTDGGIEGSQAAVVGVILTSLRCDKCKWWYDRPLMDGGTYPSCYYEVKINSVEPKSYDFCSRWEKKDA